MLFRDGIITPAISVISAVEGIGVASSALQPCIVPTSVIAIIVLFAVQARGTEAVGRLFGPALVGKRVEIDRLAPRLERGRAHFGYMEPLRLGPVLRSCDTQGLHLDDKNTEFFYAAQRSKHA
jgi:K+ transporter